MAGSSDLAGANVVIDMTQITDEMVKEAKRRRKDVEKQEEENGHGGWGKVILEAQKN